MKKYRKGFRWKRLLNKRSRKAIKRQKKARSLKKNKNIKYFTKVIIEAPEILSFLKNLEETVLFFHKVEEAVSKGNNTYLNLSKISIITGDAILYLLSITEKNRGSHNTGSIGGNVPLDHDARKYLEASGFYKYVKSNADFISVNQNFFAIRRGLLVEPKTLKEAIQFSLKKCKNNQSVNKFLKDKIYRSLNEATGNIAQHAYSKNKLRRYWWLMVEFVQKEKRLRFYVLDNGEIAENVVIKVPLIPEGLKTVVELTKRNIPTNVTLCFSAPQALLAAKAGATFISPFIGRVDDTSWDGMELISEIREIYDNYGYDTRILAASIRGPIHLKESALRGADCATMPHSAFLQLFKHPLTDIGLEKFLEDSKKLKW